MRSVTSRTMIYLGIPTSFCLFHPQHHLMDPNYRSPFAKRIDRTPRPVLETRLASYHSTLSTHSHNRWNGPFPDPAERPDHAGQTPWHAGTALDEVVQNPPFEPEIFSQPTPTHRMPRVVKIHGPRGPPACCTGS